MKAKPIVIKTPASTAQPIITASTASAITPQAADKDSFSKPHYSLPVQLASTGADSQLPPEQVGAIAAAGIQGTPSALPHFETIQAAFGKHDISHIKSYTNASAAKASHELRAEAYATGHKIAFNTSTPSLHTAAHEAAHVIQQQAGVHLKGGVGTVGDKYEQHADAVADAVVAGKPAQSLLDRYAAHPNQSHVQQADTPVQFSRKKRQAKKQVNYADYQSDDDYEHQSDEEDEYEYMEDDESEAEIEVPVAKPKLTRGKAGIKQKPNKKEPVQTPRTSISRAKNGKKRKKIDESDTESSAMDSYLSEEEAPKKKKRKILVKKKAREAKPKSKGAKKKEIIEIEQDEASAEQYSSDSEDHSEDETGQTGNLRPVLTKNDRPKVTNNFATKFVAPFSKKLVTTRNHLPLTEEQSQSHYMRSSTNSYSNVKKTPLNPSVRNPKAIGRIPSKNKSKGNDGMKQGFSLPTAARLEIIAQTDGNLTKQEKADLNHKASYYSAGADYMGLLEQEYSDELEEVESKEGKTSKKIKKEFTGIDEKWYAEHESGANIPIDFTYAKLKLEDDLSFSSGKRINTNQHKLKRFQICQTIQQSLNNQLTHVFVAAENAYPALGIGVTIPKKFVKDQKGKKNKVLKEAGLNPEVEMWTTFCMYVFLGICKAGEREHGFAVDARSSFGHLETTLSGCFQVFRINVGLIGTLQINNLVNYLKKLDKYLKDLLGNEPPIIKNQLYVSERDNNVDDKLFSLEKKGNTGIIDGTDKNQFKAMRLANQVVKAIEDNEEEEILKTLLEDEKLFQNEVTLASSNRDIIIDKELQDILEQYYGIKFQQAPHYSDYADKIRQAIGGSIYNEQIAGQKHGDDSFGSSSEAEAEINDQAVYAKKITLPWGIRAITCAIDAARHIDENLNKEKAELATMYYETADIKSQWLKQNKNKKHQEQYRLGLKDNNYFHNRHPSAKPQVHAEVHYQIWDVTSTDEEGIAKLAKNELLQNDSLKYILLVSSDTKNEYVGLDIGGHGMIRIFSKDKDLRERIYNYIIQHACTKTPWFNNQLRKGFKAKFGGVRNANILHHMGGEEDLAGAGSSASAYSSDYEVNMNENNGMPRIPKSVEMHLREQMRSEKIIAQYKQALIDRGLREGRASSDKNICLLHTLYQLKTAEGSELNDWKPFQQELGADKIGKMNDIDKVLTDEKASEWGLMIEVYKLNELTGNIVPSGVYGKMGGRKAYILFYGAHFVPLWSNE